MKRNCCHYCGRENEGSTQFEIMVDGRPRSYRDVKQVAIESAEYLKSRNPHSQVAVNDLQSGHITAINYKPQT